MKPACLELGEEVGEAEVDGERVGQRPLEERGRERDEEGEEEDVDPQRHHHPPRVRRPGLLPEGGRPSGDAWLLVWWRWPWCRMKVGAVRYEVMGLD